MKFRGTMKQVLWSWSFSSRAVSPLLPVYRPVTLLLLLPCPCPEFVTPFCPKWGPRCWHKEGWGPTYTLCTTLSYGRTRHTYEDLHLCHSFPQAWAKMILRGKFLKKETKNKQTTTWQLRKGPGRKKKHFYRFWTGACIFHFYTGSHQLYSQPWM